MTSDLSTLLKAGSFLVEPNSPKTHPDLRAVLQTRLSQYHQCLSSPNTSVESESLESLEQSTALEALNVVEGVQRIIGIEGDAADVPAIGTRDLAQLRTLLSIVFKWGVDPSLARLKAIWPSRNAGPTLSGITDLSLLSLDYDMLSSLTNRLFSLLFPNGPRSPLPQTLITTTILNRHVGDILGPSIILGWLPKSLHMGTFVAVDTLRPLTMRLLAILPPSQAIVALVAVLSSHPGLPYVRKTCAYLLSRQLLRPFGVRGLLAALLGEDESSDDDVELEKLEHVVRVVSTIPANIPGQEFYDNIVPQLLALLREDKLSSYQRAAAFSLSRLMTDAIASKVILTSLHKPLLVTTPENSDHTPDRSLSMLLPLILNSDPSPTLTPALISPIFVALYSLLFNLETVKTSDPSLVESIRGLLTTWGRIVGQDEALSILWYLLHSAPSPGWRVDLEGHIRRLDLPENADEPSFLTPGDRAVVEEMDESANILNLFPDPTHFVRFLKTIDRSDISSELFVKLLEAYREAKATDEDPLKTLLYLQLVMQIQSELTQGNSSSGVLAKPSHILSFVKHALESAWTPEAKRSTVSKQETSRFGLKNLRIVEDEGIVEDDEGDSDDEDPEEVPTAPDDEITETAINLLLSMLEAHDDLSARTEPILDDIFSLLEPLSSNHPSPSMRTLARECRMVLTARLASTSSSTWRSKKSKDEEDVQAKYQKALKLLQDPILPIRAHGLLLLRQLVQSSPRSAPQRLDPALMPAILSIFLQSVQDDDSYIFLNAVQGLSGMVEVYGNEVLRNLVNAYTAGLDGLAASNLTPQDVDTRIRVGEALGQIIRRCGEALGIYVDILVPPIFSVLRSSHLPTALRTSSLSLLAECENTYAFALMPYSIDLAEATIDLLQVEGTSNRLTAKHDDSTKDDSTKDDSTKDDDKATDPSTKTTHRVTTMDDQPTTTNSKLPPLRRAALHFLSILARSTIKQIYENPDVGQLFPPRLVQRAKVTLSYIAVVDEDTRVRVMAREAREYFVQLEQAVLGL